MYNALTRETKEKGKENARHQSWRAGGFGGIRLAV